MSKKARTNLPNKEKHPKIYQVSKKTGRSSGALKKGIYGTMVTPKVYNAQVRNKNRARAKHGLPPIEETN
jgi:hypothetical protein|tara:strand:- start:2784 stop:2993 length:210 start_codon:yes stop_codon:yes gene_type:complete